MAVGLKQFDEVSVSDGIKTDVYRPLVVKIRRSRTL